MGAGGFGLDPGFFCSTADLRSKSALREGARRRTVSDIRTGPPDARHRVLPDQHNFAVREPTVIGASNHLAGLLESQLDVLHERWSAHASRRGGTPALAANLPALLRHLIGELQSPEPGPGAEAQVPSPLPEKGFVLEAVVHEYGLLQRVVLELLEHASVPVSMRDVRRLGDWFIRAVARAVAEHGRGAQGAGAAGRSAADRPEDTQRSAGQPPKNSAPATDASAARGEPQNDEEPPARSRRDEFLVLLAHELKSPLAVIGTALSLLDQAGGDAAKSARYCETARRQMGQLVRLVDDLLDVARVKGGEIELIRQHVELGSVVQQALATARPILEARQHELQVTLAPGAFRVSGDAGRLEQVLVNLLTHAAQETAPGGSISLRLSRTDAPPGEEAVLSVRDTGRGIAADRLDGLFELMPSATAADGSAGGLELGLTLVRYLVEMHGGRIAVSSAGEGQGSEFVVHLPLSDEHEADALSAPIGQGGTSLVERRVVLVENSDDVRELLKEYIEQLGHEVLVAQDGVEALALIERTRPELALIDIGLPGMDGYEVARRVRSELSPQDIRLVALTGYGGPDVQQTARAAGFDLQVTKPIELELLRAVLAENLERQRP
jgi:signal transduction histidine kinase/CheY-like chemotaxis protein